MTIATSTLPVVDVTGLSSSDPEKRRAVGQARQK